MYGLRGKENIALKKTICTVVKKYKEHGMIGHLKGSGKLSKLTTEASVEVNAPKIVINEQGSGEENSTYVHAIFHEP